MQHKFDGEWNYFEMPHGGGATVPVRQDNMILTIPATGEVDDDNSNQGPFGDIDGTVTNTTVELVATDSVNKIKRTLIGKVVRELTCNGVLHIVIVGRYKDQKLPPVLEDQIEGTWVISKP